MKWEGDGKAKQGFPRCDRKDKDMATSIPVLAVGFAAQIFFSARILVQWIMSERARKVLSPSIFWVLSLAGSYLLCIYGFLRDDFSIVLGQFIAYYIYLWNLRMKGVWGRLYAAVKIVLLLTPLAAAALVLRDAGTVVNSFFRNEQIPVWLIVYGSAGQVIFTMRFVYQWIYSYRGKESVLPAGFWVISLVGSLTIVTYAIVRRDVVLIVGQSFGIVAYTRNLCLWYRSKGGRPHAGDAPGLSAGGDDGGSR